VKPFGNCLFEKFNINIKEASEERIR